jgi:hypothetical protein
MKSLIVIFVLVCGQILGQGIKETNNIRQVVNNTNSLSIFLNTNILKHCTSHKWIEVSSTKETSGICAITFRCSQCSQTKTYAAVRSQPIFYKAPGQVIVSCNNTK